MSEMLKIKLTIADRVYPLSIHPDQEASLRASAKKIGEMIKQLENSYAVRDKQDVLAMCALQFAAQLKQNDQPSVKKDASDLKIEELIELIDVHLSAY